MAISGISSTPNFGNRTTRRAEEDNLIVRTLTDPTDIRNKDAAVAGSVATGGLTGAAVMAARLKTMRNAAAIGKQCAKKVTTMQAKNASLFTGLTKTIAKTLKSSKLTAWAAKLLNSKAAKSVGGILAAGVTAAQLFSAGDMAMEAITKRD